MASIPVARTVDRSYLLHERLGEGGMGAVYRATQLTSGKSVALKLVKLDPAQRNQTAQSPTALETKLRLALAREFQTLASLHHPNVIRVLSYGFDDELGSYFTMELLSAPQTFLRATTQLPLEDKIRLLGQLFRALIYIHQRGIVHRDIKPNNVLVVNGEAKLLDFGIAVAAASAAEVAGTVDYMAPELLRRKAATVASDLYSVGVLMHQVLTGAYPYSRESLSMMLGDILGEDSDKTLGSTVVELLGNVRTHGPTARHDSGPAATPTPVQGESTDREANAVGQRTLKLSEDLPPALADIVRKLLQRRPEDRYQDAHSVLRDLAAAVQMPLPLETAETRESFLQSTELVGREAELTLLQAELESVKAGQRRGYLIGGESGIGKSRLISELRTQALVRGFWVAEGQSVTEGGAYYQEWLPLLRALYFRAELSDAEASVFKGVLPGIAELLGRNIADPPKVEAEEMQTRLGSTLITVLGKVSKPLLLILEDLQWGRKESLDLLSRVLKSTTPEGMKLLLVGTHRTDESPELEKKLPELKSLTLKRLETTDITRLSERMLGEVGKNSVLVDYLQRQTEGNVFFLIEIVRALAEDAGELRRIGEGMLPETVLTVGIERIVERRLEHVGPAYLPVLECAAAMGRRLDPAVLERIHPGLGLRTFLDGCANCAVLETQGSEWKFAHDKLREAILKRMTRERRRSLHRQIGEALEATYSGAERDSLVAQLAFHYACGQRPDRAYLYYEQAGEQAMRLGLLTEARAHYRAALTALEELQATDEHRRQRLELLLKLLHSSQTSESFETLSVLIKEAEEILGSLHGPEGLSPADLIRQARLDYQHGRAHFYAGRAAEALRYYQRTLPRAEECGDLELLAIPHAAIGMALCSQGYMGKGHALIARAVPALRQLGDLYEEVKTSIYLGMSQCMIGRYREGIREMERQGARAQEVKQAQIIPIVRTLRGFVERNAMNWPGVLEAAAGLGDAAAKLGEKPYAILPWSLEGWALTHLGRYEQGLALRTKALALAAELGGKYIAVDWFLAGDAEMALLRGDVAAALSIARDVVKASSAAGLPMSWGIAERVLALALHRQGGTLDEVEAHLRDSQRALMLGDLRLELGQTEFCWGRMLRERGDAAAAQPHLELALSIFETAGCDYAVAEIKRSQG